MRVSEKIRRMFEETPFKEIYIVTPYDMAESEITFVPADNLRPQRTIAVPNLVAKPAQDPSVPAQPKDDATLPGVVPVVPVVPTLTTLPEWPAAAPRVFLYEEDSADPMGKRSVTLAIWRTETVPPGPGSAPDLVVWADLEIRSGASP